MLRLVILQPHFLPFIGYFDLMRRADLFAYYDTVQYVKRSWHSRTYITENGMARWLSAPVGTIGGSRRALSEMRWADETGWRRRTARRLLETYAGAAPEAVEAIAERVLHGPAGLCDWNIETNGILARFLRIGTPTIRTSTLPAPSGDKQLKIIHLCEALGATHYLCGPGSRHYVRDDEFARHGITVEWLSYDYAYRVPTPEGLDVFPSVLDFICRRGYDATEQAFTPRAGQI